MSQRDPWANYWDYPSESQTAVQNWAYQNSYDSVGRPRGGYPLQDTAPPNQGPSYGSWRGKNKGQKGKGKGKAKAPY